MYGQVMLRNFFSTLNIVLIVYLLEEPGQIDNIKKKWYSYFLCIGSLILIRVMENGTSLHIVYHYMTIIMIVMVIGHFLFQYHARYCFLIASIYLLMVVSGQLIGGVLVYKYSESQVLAESPEKYQILMLLIIEIVIIVGSLGIKKIIGKIPRILSTINMSTIIIPLFINIIVVAVAADTLYNEKQIIVDNIWSVLTIIGACIIMFVGTGCNIVILESYLNVKKIENEKKLQIDEMSRQYDYYMKQSKDMENIRRLSHDIKNHLEVLKENVDYHQKLEYINGIERKLDQYQSYYKTGNTFMDNLLHAKKVEAFDKKIEFKVLADFIPFKQIKNEDLCVIISNMVDNALRECSLIKEEYPEEECLVQVKARKIKGFLSIICENSLRESQAKFLKENIIMETTKEDKRNHGWGVKNIKNIVRDYGGEVSFNVIDDMFSVSVLIPIEI